MYAERSGGNAQFLSMELMRWKRSKTLIDRCQRSQIANLSPLRCNVSLPPPASVRLSSGIPALASAGFLRGCAGLYANTQSESRWGEGAGVAGGGFDLLGAEYRDLFAS